MKKGKSGFLLIISALLIALLAYSGLFGINLGDYRVKSFGQSINKGLDLVGGTSLLMEIKADNVDSAVVNRTIELISRRVNKEGVSEIPIVQEGDKRIRIEIPGEFDSEKVLKTIGKTGELTFVDPEGNVILTGKDVKESSAYMTQEGKNLVSLKLNEEGTKKFADATQKFLGKPITIKMDEDVLTSPNVNSVISNGEAVIEGMKSLEEAKTISGIIQSGALPVPVEAVSVKTVGPTIGLEAMGLTKKAGAVGLLCVMLFMMLYYRAPGIIASVAVSLYVVILLYAFAAFGVVLTLSGAAAVILTIGMAVDANVLIFERTKEELRAGKSIRSAVDSGFDRALSSILDSNITTMIAGLVLYFMGTGSVKGFAVTLMIGIIISIFTALTVSKFLLKHAVNAGIITKPSHFGVKRG